MREESAVSKFLIVSIFTIASIVGSSVLFHFYNFLSSEPTIKNTPVSSQVEIEDDSQS
ncbi:MAG: hypothetical protein QNJ54_17645 [Prochloraceae cyanobacterium]|nr:hypothetical protein [Prochloraceae cyanobacterium]